MAYRPKNTFVVQLESPEGNAYLEFKKPLTTDVLDSISKIKSETGDAEKLRSELSENMKQLVSVSGFENSDGEPVTVDDIKALKLDFQTLRAINVGYNQAIFKVEENSEAKKDSESA